MEIEKTRNRRQPAEEIVKNMISERRQLLALSLQVSNIDNNEADSSDRDLLEEFCQVLVDYIAAGHFGLYSRIAEGKERRKSVAETASKLYPRISDTTEIALAFSEKYNSDNDIKDFSQLQKDLSYLIENLTTRIEMEDKLIEAL